MAISQNFPSIRPTLSLNFASSRTLDPRITFRRNSIGTYFDSNSVLRTASANVARIDHDPLTGESLGLLVEEPRENSIRNNTMQGAVAGTPGTAPTNWTLLGSTSGLTQQIVGTGTENGIDYIDVRYSGTTTGAISSGTIARYETTTQIAASSGQTWTASEYIKLVGGSLANISSLQIGVVERSAAGGFLDSTVVAITPTAAPLATQRRSATRVLNNATTAFITSQLLISASSGVAIDITLRIGLPQLEQGAFATSVIPTTGATVPRSADVVSITGSNFSSWYRQDEGSFLVSTFAPKGLVIFGTGNTFDDTHYAVVGTSNNIAFRSGGANQAILSSAVSTTAITSLAIGYATNSFAAVSNGGPIATSASGSVSNNHAQLKIGSAAWNMGGGSSINGTIRRLVYWPVRLPNSVLQAITA